LLKLRGEKALHLATCQKTHCGGRGATRAANADKEREGWSWKDTDIKKGAKGTVKMWERERRFVKKSLGVGKTEHRTENFFILKFKST